MDYCILLFISDLHDFCERSYFHHRNIFVEQKSSCFLGKFIQNSIISTRLAINHVRQSLDNIDVHENSLNIESVSTEQLAGRIFAMSYEQALDLLTRDDRFRATVYAMNTLLVDKGIYTQEEFQKLFVEWARKEQHKSSKTISRASEVSA